MKNITKTIQILIASGSVFLAACAGGDESQVTAPVERAVSNNAVVEATGVADDCYQRDLLNDDLIAAVNAARAEAQVCQGVNFPAVSPVAINLRLQNAAVNHSDDMATENFFDHTGSDGLTSGDRADQEGYDWTRVGENLAAGQSDPEAVVEDWIDSNQGHCELLMSARVTEMGGSCKSGDESTDFASYWTLVMATTE